MNFKKLIICNCILKYVNYNNFKYTNKIIIPIKSYQFTYKE